MTNTAGSSDFCVRKISAHGYGRREIEIAEQVSEQEPGVEIQEQQEARR